MSAGYGAIPHNLPSGSNSLQQYGTPYEFQLVTLRLILRDFREDDWPALHAFRSDPDVARYMDWEPETPEQTRAWVLATIPHNRAQPRLSYNLSIVHRADEQIIGWIGIGVPSRRSAYEREYDFGYALARAYWGQGLATEAAQAIAQYAFDRLQLSRLICLIDHENRASQAVARKIGMRFEKEVDDGKGPALMYSMSKPRSVSSEVHEE